MNPSEQTEVTFDDQSEITPVFEAGSRAGTRPQHLPTIAIENTRLDLPAEVQTDRFTNAALLNLDGATQSGEISTPEEKEEYLWHAEDVWHDHQSKLRQPLGHLNLLAQHASASLPSTAITPDAEEPPEPPSVTKRADRKSRGDGNRSGTTRVTLDRNFEEASQEKTEIYLMGEQLFDDLTTSDRGAESIEEFATRYRSFVEQLVSFNGDLADYIGRRGAWRPLDSETTNRYYSLTTIPALDRRLAPDSQRRLFDANWQVIDAAGEAVERAERNYRNLKLTEAGLNIVQLAVPASALVKTGLTYGGKAVLIQGGKFLVQAGADELLELGTNYAADATLNQMVARGIISEDAARKTMVVFQLLQENDPRDIGDLINVRKLAIAGGVGAGIVGGSSDLPDRPRKGGNGGDGHGSSHGDSTTPSSSPDEKGDTPDQGGAELPDPDKPGVDVDYPKVAAASAEPPKKPDSKGDEALVEQVVAGTTAETELVRASAESGESGGDGISGPPKSSTEDLGQSSSEDGGHNDSPPEKPEAINEKDELEEAQRQSQADKERSKAESSGEIDEERIESVAPDPRRRRFADLTEEEKISTYLGEGYDEISHPDALAKGKRMFINRATGDRVRFDRGKPGAHGNAGKDYFHRFNPNRTSKQDEYLDISGNPVPRNSKASHIYPELE